MDGLDWEITDNTIYGDGDASHIGIATRNGYGIIDGNTLIDADGGILVDGITANQVVNITNNDISQSAGRSAPSAVGIWAEDCASSSINAGGNTISVMENALVTDGCDINDSGSTLTASWRSRWYIYTLYRFCLTPTLHQILNINEGDSVRWRSVEYYNNSGTWEQHDIVANDSTWGSGTTMNLGQTYVKTFSTAGTYEYHCSIHPDMYGKKQLKRTRSGFSSTGVNILGTTDEITLDGTSVSGFDTGVEQYGGELTLSGDAIISGGDYRCIRRRHRRGC